eukprot:2471699-Amphidinium_carterae.2
MLHIGSFPPSTLGPVRGSKTSIFRCNWIVVPTTEKNGPDAATDENDGDNDDDHDNHDDADAAASASDHAATTLTATHVLPWRGSRYR